MEEQDVAKALKTLSARIDELSNSLVEKKGGTGMSGGTNGIKFNTVVLDMRNIGCLGGVFLGGFALGYFVSRKLI